MKQITITEKDGLITTKAVGMKRIEVIGHLQLALHNAIKGMPEHSNTPPTEVEPIQKDLLNNAEAMELLRCSKRTLQNWRKSNKIPFKMIGSKIYYTRDNLEKLIK